jgi:hypothetical protein
MISDKEIFKELWSWLALNPEAEKRDWPGWMKYGSESYVHYNRCPACRMAGVKFTDQIRSCSKCPIRNAASKHQIADPLNPDRCLFGLYGRWVECGRRYGDYDPGRRMEIAGIIANLEWEEM